MQICNSMYVYNWWCLDYRTEYPILSRNMSLHINISNLQPPTLQVHRRSANVDAAKNDGCETSWVNARWCREKGSCFSRHHLEIFWAGGLLGSVKSPVCIRFLTKLCLDQRNFIQATKKFPRQCMSWCHEEISGTFLLWITSSKVQAFFWLTLQRAILTHQSSKILKKRRMKMKGVQNALKKCNKRLQDFGKHEVCLFF